MTTTPVHDFLLPLLNELVDEAVASGIDRGVTVAVLIDLITSPSFNTAFEDEPGPNPGGEAGTVA